MNNPDEKHPDECVPGRSEGTFIVLLALLQGLLLYIAARGTEESWWLLSCLGGRVCWYTLVLAVPTVMMLSLQSLRDPRFWQHTAGLFAGFAALSAWAARSATAELPVTASSVLGPFGVTMAVGAFVVTPYLQARLAQGRWCAPYPRLFADAWQNGLTLILAGVFVALGWALLMLWAELFKLIGIGFFAELFRQRPFFYLASGLFFGLGVMIARTQHGPVQKARSILFALFIALLPVLAVVVLLFLVSLPFTGLEPLWEGGSGLWRMAGVATVMSMLVAHQVLFLNAVYQDGRHAPPYPWFLCRLIEASLVILPLFALIALWSLGLRIAEYGWTPVRFWAVAAVVVLLLYAGGYALAVLWRRSAWPELLPSVNVGVSFVMLALVILGNSPVLDPHRIAAASQLERLRALPNEQICASDLRWLRFEAGRRGVAALRALGEQARDTDRDELVQRVERELARQWRDTRAQRAAPDQRITEAGELAEQLEVAGDGPPPGEDYLRLLLEEGSGLAGCLLRNADCVVMQVDASMDGRDERLLCNLGNEHRILCMLAEQRDGRWRQVTALRWPATDEVRNALRNGEVDVEAPRWGVLRPKGARGQQIQDPAHQ